MRFDGRRYAAGNLVLDSEYLAHVAVIAFSPLVDAGSRIDKLRIDTHPLSRPANAALQDVADAELAGDLLHVDRSILVGECGVAGDHEQPPDARELGDQILGNAVGEVALVAIRAHVGEGQYDQRGLLGQNELLRRVRAGRGNNRFNVSSTTLPTERQPFRG